jgi:sulfite oxidase
MQRRTFIIAAVAGGVGLLEYTYFSGWMNNLRDTRPRMRVRDYLAQGERAALAAITPNEDFYNVQKGTPVRVDAGLWRLRVDGLVDRPVSLTLDQIRSRPAVERLLTLECVDNRIGGYYIGNAMWKGVELAPLLAEAGVRPEPRNVALYGADGLTTGHPLEALRSAFLAYEMNGQPLPVNHGFPVRILIPGKYGYKQPKWLTRIELVDRHYLGYWERKGWSDVGERGIHARFDSPDELKQLRGSSFVLAGYALGGASGVKAVEISTGEGWAPAELFSNPSAAAWAFWKYVWKPAPGRYELRVRGIGGDGAVQGPDPSDPFPSGATGQQVLHVSVSA